MRKRKRVRAKKTTRKRAAALAKRIGRKKAGRVKKAAPRKRTVQGKKMTRGRGLAPNWAAPEEKGPGPDTAGQSGDIQGLSGVASVDSESVAELAEEGQAFEAEVVSGVENAPDADVREVTTKEVPEDDVPPEYRERE
jgi:hypothetical protein